MSRALSEDFLTRHAVWSSSLVLSATKSLGWSQPGGLAPGAQSASVLRGSLAVKRGVFVQGPSRQPAGPPSGSATLFSITLERLHPRSV